MLITKHHKPYIAKRHAINQVVEIVQMIEKGTTENKNDDD